MLKRICSEITVIMLSIGLLTFTIPFQQVNTHALRFGVNYYSTHNHYERYYLSDAELHRDFRLFRDQGFEYVTLCATWTYLEPEMGVYNEAAIDDLIRVCDFAAQYNLKVSIDFHTMMHLNTLKMPEWLSPRKFEAVFLNTTFRQAWLSFLDHMAMRLNQASIWSWHMMNEPCRRAWACDVSLDEFIQLFEEMKAIFKAYSDRPVSIRFAAQTFDKSYHFNSDPRIYNLLDYISLNYHEVYCTTENLAHVVSDAQQNGCPVIITEFGSNATSDAAQANDYQRILELFRNLGITDFIAWMWRADHNYPNPDAPGTGWNLAKDVDGTPRPAFHLLKNEHELAIAVEGFGSTVPAVGSYNYADGSEVNVTATPDTGWVFSKWTFDGKDVGSGNPYMVTMNSPHSLTATFIHTSTQFDFGTASSPVESGYTQATEATLHSSSIGYGWSGTSGLSSRDRSLPDDLRRDLVQSTSDNTFLVDLPNGEYQVIIVIGDYSYMHDLIDIYAEGILTVNDLTVAKGTFQDLAFTVTVSDGQLALLFHEDGGIDGNWAINAITIGPVVPCDVHLESTEDTGDTSNLGSMIFDEVSYGLPDDISKPAGTYLVSYTADDYFLDHWETSGGVSVSDSIVTVIGDGTLIAVYKVRPTMFDFGTASSAVETGYVRVDHTSLYSSITGYGWSAVSGLSSRDRSLPDDLRRDLVQSTGDRAFLVDLPNGDYQVIIIIGDCNYMHDLIDISAESLLMEDDLTVAKGTFTEVILTVTVSDSQLTLLFHDDGGTDANWVVAAIIIGAPTPPAITDFDFGTDSSPVGSGYAAVSESTAYSVMTGYGWGRTAGLSSRDRGAPDDLRRDLVQSLGDQTFLVDMPNGDYDVTLIIGDHSYMHDLIDVSAEGTLKINDLTVPSDTFSELPFTVTVSDGQLTLDFHDNGGIDHNWVINAITIEPLS